MDGIIIQANPGFVVASPRRHDDGTVKVYYIPIIAWHIRQYAEGPGALFDVTPVCTTGEIQHGKKEDWSIRYGDVLIYHGLPTSEKDIIQRFEEEHPRLHAVG